MPRSLCSFIDETPLRDVQHEVDGDGLLLVAQIRGLHDRAGLDAETLGAFTKGRDDLARGRKTSEGVASVICSREPARNPEKRK